MNLFEESPDLLVGRVMEVSGTTIRVEIDSELSELTRVVQGRVCPVGQLASIVKVHYGRRIIFAYVRMLRMRSELAMELGHDPIAPGDDSRILEADLFAEGIWTTSDGEGRLAFSRGVETYPLPLQNVYLTTPPEMEEIFSSAEGAFAANETSPLVPVAEYVGGNGAVCRANINKLFGQHCAVLGSTGSGKSATVAAIIRSVLEHQGSGESNLRPRVILIDPHGEYGAAFKNEAAVYRVYESETEKSVGSSVLRVPYWLMSGDELRGLIIGKTEAEATSQNNIVYKALKHSRMVAAGIVQSLPVEVVGGQEEVLCSGRSLSDIASFDRDRPYKFCLDEFVKHIDEVQGRKFGRQDSASASDRKSLDSILDKLTVLRSDPRLSCLMRTEEGDTLQGVIAQLTSDVEGRTLKIIDLSGVPNEVAGTLTAVISRLIFAYKIWQTREERERDPILLVCEEAHRYVPNKGEAQYREAQDAIRRIAKEGRKYGLGLMLVSQRPSDVESTVLSQCNSWIVLRLTNGQDQTHVGQFLPDSLAGLTTMLPSLGRREAIFVGEAAALPARVRIRELVKDELPDSQDIDFANGWAMDPLPERDIGEIVARWCD